MLCNWVLLLDGRVNRKLWKQDPNCVGLLRSSSPSQTARPKLHTFQLHGLTITLAFAHLGCRTADFVALTKLRVSAWYFPTQSGSRFRQLGL